MQRRILEFFMLMQIIAILNQYLNHWVIWQRNTSFDRFTDFHLQSLSLSNVHLEEN